MVEIVCLLAMSVWAIFMHRALTATQLAQRELLTALLAVRSPGAQAAQVFVDSQREAPPMGIQNTDLTLEDLG